MAQIAQIDSKWALSGDVIISSVVQILTASEALTIDKNTSIDFANVTDIDTSAISLILEWKRRALLENQPLKFVNIPANLTSLTQLYWVDALIN